MKIQITEGYNVAKMMLYRNAINQCCDPECSFGYGLLTHHILPLSKGGSDTYDNYIVLCGKCHWARKNHKAEDIRMIELRVYKFYAENLFIGHLSQDVSEEQFKAILKAIVNSSENAPECPIVDKTEPTTCEAKRIRQRATMGVGSLVDKVGRGYQQFHPLFWKNGGWRIIVGMR